MSPRMVDIRLLRIRFFQVLPQDIAMRCAELFSRYNWLVAQAAEPVGEIRLHAAICIEVPFVITASSQKTIQTKPFSCRRFFAAISTEPLCPALCIPLSAADASPLSAPLFSGSRQSDFEPPLSQRTLHILLFSVRRPLARSSHRSHALCTNNSAPGAARNSSLSAPPRSLRSLLHLLPRSAFLQDTSW